MVNWNYFRRLLEYVSERTVKTSYVDFTKSFKVLIQAEYKSFCYYRTEEKCLFVECHVLRNRK